MAENKVHAKFYLRSAYLQRGMVDATHIDVIRIWAKIEHPEKEINGKNYTDGYSMQLWDFDCTNGQDRIVRTVTYDSGGNELGSFEDEQQKFSNPLTGSLEESVLKKVCGMFGHKEKK
jgi:hypothetical protein